MFSLAGYIASLEYSNVADSDTPPPISWEELIQKFYFESLRMSNSTFLHQNVPDLKMFARTAMHNYTTGKWISASPDFYRYL